MLIFSICHHLLFLSPPQVYYLSKNARGERCRKVWCGKCAGCLVPNCRDCVACKDMVKYGGKGTKRKPCWWVLQLFSVWFWGNINILNKETIIFCVASKTWSSTGGRGRSGSPAGECWHFFLWHFEETIIFEILVTECKVSTWSSTGGREWSKALLVSALYAFS